MTRPVALCSLVLLGLGLSLAWPATKQEANPNPKAVDRLRIASPAALLAKLAQPITLEQGIDAPLKDGLQFLIDRFDITILVDTQAFKDGPTGIDNVEDLPVRLPKLVNVRLGSVLQILLKQVHATYLIRPTYIEVTTLQSARPEGWSGNESETPRVFLPLVYADFTKQPLGDAVKQLSDTAEISVVIDARVADKEGVTPVSGTFKNVPLDTAVRLLADMAGLDVVLVDNVVYVTSKANARIIQAEKDKRRRVLAAP